MQQSITQFETEPFTEVRFSTTEIQLIRQMLSLINVKLRNKNINIATIRYHYDGALITNIPRRNKMPLIKIHHNAAKIIRYLGCILRSR